jgi:hypothetical protein
MSHKKEIWKTFTIDGKKPTVPYVISNHGRFGVLPADTGKVEVRTFKPTAGNYRFNTRQNGKNKAIFIAREVALAFLKKPSPKYRFVIHKDHNYLNNDVSNLKWATREEHRAHTTLSPRSVMARQKKAITRSSHARVLDEKSVTALKKMIWDPKRKLSYRQLADKFGVSEMQIYRIKTGQFWYHIKVDNEPVHKKYKQNLSNIAYHEKLSQRKPTPVKKSAKKATKKTTPRKKKK